MAAPDRPAVTGQFWDQSQLASGPAFVSDGAKKRERGRRTEKRKTKERRKDASGKGGRVAHTAKAPGGFIEFAVSAPPKTPPPPYPTPPPHSFQCEHPESDSTKPPVRHWETAVLQPAIEARGFPAKSMMRQK